jgi:endoglucanase
LKDHIDYDVSGFVKAQGSKLVNGEGREFLFRGVGFGSWLLPEGYMWLFPDQGDRPRRIEQMIRDLIGEEKAKQFWEHYYQKHTSEADIRQIAEEGFNSVRVPINARFLLDEEETSLFKEQHLQIIDQIIEWCRTHRLYVILDLHGAPGGQTGTNIDDSENDQPELFMDERNRRLTIEIWHMLAERYKDEWIVAGYDLLNEPLPNWFSAYNSMVMPLYQDIVNAIRKVDNRHMIILEGVHWATDWSIFTNKLDDNLMLQFHKYWNNPDTESIQVYLDKRVEWNVPIFMGEGGENNKEWYAGAFRLFEDHEISWNFWTWKKMGKGNSPCRVKTPNQWQQLVDYLQGGAKPDVVTAERILWEYLDNLSFDHCVYYPYVVRALFRRPQTHIPAIFYGYRGEGVSFSIANRTSEHVGFRINDGVDIRFVESEREMVNFQHSKGEPWQIDERLYVLLAPGDWLAYDMQVAPYSSPTLYTIHLWVSAFGENGSIAITVDGDLVGVAEVYGQTWNKVQPELGFSLDSGQHTIVLKAEKNPVRIEWFEVISKGPVPLG